MNDGRTSAGPWFGWLVAVVLILIAGGVYLKLRPSLLQPRLSAELLRDDLDRRLPVGSTRQHVADWLASCDVPEGYVVDLAGPPPTLFAYIPDRGFGLTKLAVQIKFDADNKVARREVLRP